jgi:hypothetical protein
MGQSVSYSEPTMTVGKSVCYKYSILLSIPLALLAGAFTVVAPEAYRKIRTTRTNSTGNNGFISFQT